MIIDMNLDGQKVCVMQLSTNYIDSDPECLNICNTIQEGINFIIDDTNTASKHCPNECIPKDQFTQKKFTNWHNDGCNYWYGDEENLVLIEDKKNDYKFIPICESNDGDLRYICFDNDYDIN